MGSRKQTKITVETERVVIINRLEAVRGQCVACGMYVQMVSPDEAAAMARVSSRTIYRWVESDKIHYAEAAEGLLRICTNSLNSAVPPLPVE